MRRLLLLTPLLALLVPAAGTSVAASASCVNLTAPAALRATLTKVHGRPRENPIGRGSLFYGRCGATRYAIADFTGALGDQPEVFRKLDGQPWRDRGDGQFEDGCHQRAVPKALVTAWGFHCS